MNCSKMQENNNLLKNKDFDNHNKISEQISISSTNRQVIQLNYQK